MSKRPFSHHTGGTAKAAVNVLDCESRDPVLVEIRSRDSFYGRPFHSAVSIRAAICFMRKCEHSILVTYLGCFLEQCTMPTGLFYPFKLTSRFVIIGCLVLLTVVIFILFLQKSLYFLSKQYRPLAYIISFSISIVSMLDLHCLSNSFSWVLGIIGLRN